MSGEGVRRLFRSRGLDRKVQTESQAVCKTNKPAVGSRVGAKGGGHRSNVGPTW